MKADTGPALIYLQRAFEESGRQHWRPAYESVPAKLILSKDFISMMSGIGNRMNLMREELRLDEAFVTQ